MLIKLDSGDYINTEYVIKTMTDTAGSVGEKGGQLVYLVDTGYSRITESDRDRIVEAMGGHASTNDAIHTDSGGYQYQLMTGRELIAGLADDAMQDEQLGNSYCNVLAIVPGHKYKAYLDGNAGGLNGEWEEA